MTVLRLNTDEDSMRRSLVEALRARSINARTVDDENMRCHSDQEQLQWATEQGRVLYSFNVADYYQLHTQLAEQGKHHGGILLGQQQRYSIGDQTRGVLKIMATLTAKDMIDNVVFLSAWV